METRVPTGGWRFPNAAFLTTLVELRFSLNIMHAILQQDDAFIALATLDSSGRNKAVVERTALDFAIPLLKVLLEFLRQHRFVFPHLEHDTAMKTFAQQVEGALLTLACTDMPDNHRRIGAGLAIGHCRQLIGLAIKSEMGAVASTDARSANHKAAKK